MTPRKLFIISGEASGDLHGSNLVKALKEQSTDLEIQGWGGELMQAAGVELKEHYKNLAFMGFAEVIMNLRTIIKNFKRCKSQIEAFRPDAVIFIDYPGFNLRMAEWVTEKGIKSLYYISPQIWAWKQNRVHKIKKYVDQMYTILPFEADFYKKFGVDVHYVGHPLLDVVSEAPDEKQFRINNDLDQRPILAVLPGSRTQEIDRMLGLMLKSAEEFPEYQIVIAGAPSKDYLAYEKYISDKVSLVFGQTYALFNAAAAGWVTSGTATLEAAISEMPQVVVYKANGISYQIARRLVKIKYISLVNLIMDKEVVRELIQRDASVKELRTELRKIISNTPERAELLSNYKRLKVKLGNSGASKKTATHMLKTIEEQK
ncbi:MAG: lipid-A-disaccharide synthase [Flavobacteriales bacterium]